MSDYGDLIGQTYGAQNPALSTTVGSIDEDPDKAQRAIDLAKATGVPPTSIYGDLDEFERQHKAILASDIVANNPHLSDFVQSDPMVPKLFNRSYGQLDELSANVSKMGLLQRLRQGLDLSTLAGSDDPLARFKGGGPIGDTGATLEDLKNHPFQSAVVSAIATFPDLIFRGIGGVFETGADEIKNIATAIGGESLGREAGAVAETEAMGLSGHHAIHLPEEPVTRPHQLDEGAQVSPKVAPAQADSIKRALYYAQNQREPLPTMIPEYDEYRAKQNAEDINDLKEATRSAEALPERDANPELVRSFIAQHTPAEMGIGGDAVAAAYGDKVPTPDDNLLGWVPGIEDKLAIARATGDDVSVPIADWLAHAGADTLDLFKDDIRVRPNGITANEVKLAADQEAASKEAIEAAKPEAEVAEAAPTASAEPGPIPEPVPSLRAATALEPMLSVGDRKLTLARMPVKEVPFNARFGPEQGFHDFDLLDENSRRVGSLNLSEQAGGKDLYVEMINGRGGLGARDFGPALMRDLKRQLKTEFPNAEYLVGHRVSGMRDKFQTFAAPSSMVRVRLDATDAKSMDEFGKVLEGGKWETYSPNTQAYIKPYAEYSAEDRQLIDIVSDELDRIVPKKLAIALPDTIKASAAGMEGQRAGSDIRVGGTYISYRETYPILLAALDADDVLGTARHEAIHHLRQYGFFEPEEWNTLTNEALAGGWLSKYKIDSRYPTASPNLKLEEAVAEAYKDWAGRQDKLGERAAELAQADSPLDAIFRKMKAFFDAIKERIGALLGKDPTWEDIFQKVSTGEVGGREGTEPLDARAFNEALSTQEPKLKLREDDSFGNAKSLTILDATGKRVGDIDLHINGTELFIDGMNQRDGVPNSLGPSQIRGLLPELKRLYPEAETVTGHRISGARWQSELGKGDLSPSVKLSVAEPPEGGSRVFERAAALGMTVDQFKAYDKLIQARHAEDIAAAQKRIDNEQRRTQTKEWRDQRRQVRAEVAAQIRQRPDVAADLFFSSGELYGQKIASGYKLDTDRLTPEQRAAIPKDYQARGGLNPDDVANVFGYGSGDAMLDRLGQYNAAKKAAGMGAKDFVARVTNMEADRQMQIRHGNLEDNIVDSVKEQVASETQLDILHEETHKLGMEIGQAPLDKGAILSGIRDQFSKVQLGSFSSDRYLATAGKAGRAAELALLAKKPAEAFKEKQRQYFATALANEAIKTEKELAKFDKVAKQFSKRTLATIDQAYTNFIHDILMRVGKPVRRSIQDLETEISEGEYKSLPEFVEGKETHGLREVPVADILMDPNFRKRFDDLTVDEFNAVNTSIKTLIKNGRDEKKITKAGEEADLGEIKGQMITQLKEFPEQKYDAKGGRSMGPLPPGLAHTLRSYGIAHIQVESLLNRWDRGDPNGVFQQYVMRDLVTAANNESAMNKRYAARVAAIDDKADLSKDVDNSIFKVPGTDQVMKLNRGNLRAVLLNLGNDSNMSKLARGYKLEPAQVMAWARQHATPEDWQWAQKMGDIFAEIKIEADEMYRHLSGVAPESIPIKPVDMGNAPALKGWYYPIIFHPQFEGASKKLMGKDALEQEGFIRATTPSGYTKARTGYAGPMALDLDMLPARMKQMLHDIAMRPAIINASKVFYDKGVRSAIFTHFGGEWRDMLTPYLVDVANSANYVPKDQRALIQASEFIRRNMISTLVGFNPGTVAKHFATAGVQSMMEVGPQNFLKALKSLTSINERTGESNWQFAMRESQELQRRHQNYEETLGGTINTMMPGGKFMSFRDTVQRYAATPVAISDLVSAVPTWLAQYEKTITEGGTSGDALYMADRAVRRAHGSTAITNRSKVMRGGALSQWMASVYGFFNHVMNRQYELMWKAGETLDMVKDKEGTYQDAMKQGGQHTAMLFAYVLAPALIEEMVTPLISNDDESWGEKAAKGVAFTLGASWVGVRDIASAILNGRDPSVGLFSTAYKTISDVSRDLSKSAPLSKEHAGRIVKDGATLMGTLTGTVPAQIGKTAQFAYGVHAGVEHPKGPWGWMVGSRFGTLKNHSGTFQEYMRHH